MSTTERSNGKSNGWLIIMNISLADSEIHRLLTEDKHKIKVSTGTLPNTCIFPLSSVAFMIIPITETVKPWPPKENCSIDPNLTRRLEKFTEFHHKRYVILTAPMLGTDEQKIMSILQRKYMTSGLSFLVAHNSTECVENMSSIVRVTSKATTTLIRERMEKVCKQLQSERAVLATLRLCGVSRHAGTVLLDGCGSLASVTQASINQFKECSLDSNTAQHIHTFFSCN